MKNTHNPDIDTEEIEKVKTKISKTKHNMEVAHEIIDKTDDDNLKKTLMQKNERRQKTLSKFKDEMKRKY